MRAGMGEYSPRHEAEQESGRPHLGTPRSHGNVEQTARAQSMIRDAIEGIEVPAWDFQKALPWALSIERGFARAVKRSA